MPTHRSIQPNGKRVTSSGSGASVTTAQPLVLQVAISRASIKNASARALSILSAVEVRDLVACEEVIAKGWDTFIAVGRALAQIRDKRLYRADFETFETYCRQKWNYGKSQAYRLIGAAEVIQHLSPIGDVQMPRSESQVRPLLGLKPDEMKAVWREAVQKAGKESVTARLVKQMAAHLKAPASSKNGAKKKAPTTEDLEAALDSAEELLKKARRSFDNGDNAAVVSLLTQIASTLRSTRTQ